MAGLTKFKIEMEMAKRLGKLLEDAAELHALCSTHGLAVPEPLSRLLGEAPALGQSATPKLIIPPMPRPEEPEGASPSWIWVPEGEAAVTSLVLAWLNQATERLTSAQIFSEVEKRKPGIAKGSIANLGTRFEDLGWIDRNEDGWLLVRREVAPVLHRGHLWGEPLIFENSETAAYRRRALKHLLRSFTGGLQNMQLTDALKENCPWFHGDIPVTKDLIKMDVKELEEEGFIRRKGGASGKWELTE